MVEIEELEAQLKEKTGEGRPFSILMCMLVNLLLMQRRLDQLDPGCESCRELLRQWKEKYSLDFNQWMLEHLELWFNARFEENLQGIFGDYAAGPSLEEATRTLVQEVISDGETWHTALVDRLRSQYDDDCTFEEQRPPNFEKLKASLEKWKLDPCLELKRKFSHSHKDEPAWIYQLLLAWFDLLYLKDDTVRIKRTPFKKAADSFIQSMGYPKLETKRNPQPPPHPFHLLLAHITGDPKEGHHNTGSPPLCIRPRPNLRQSYSCKWLDLLQAP